MTDNKALIARLRRLAETTGWSNLCDQAADALEAAAVREEIANDAQATVREALASDMSIDLSKETRRREAAEARNARLEAVAEAAKALGHDRVDGMSEYWDDGKLRSAIAALEGEAK